MHRIAHSFVGPVCREKNTRLNGYKVAVVQSGALLTLSYSSKEDAQASREALLKTGRSHSVKSRTLLEAIRHALVDAQTTQQAPRPPDVPDDVPPLSP